MLFGQTRQINLVVQRSQTGKTPTSWHTVWSSNAWNAWRGFEHWWCTEASRPSKTIARRSGILQRCVCFRTFVICFIPSCRLFIPLAFVSYPNELFSYLLQHFHTILVYLKTYGMQLVWLSTAIVFFHTLGICFIPKWPCFIPGARFSYLFGIQTKKHHDQGTKYLCSVWNESTA